MGLKPNLAEALTLWHQQQRVDCHATQEVQAVLRDGFPRNGMGKPILEPLGRSHPARA
jgi:hypothetical protein